MSMFIQQVTAAVFACTLMKTLFTSAATDNENLVALIYTIEKKPVSKLRRLSFLKILLVHNRVALNFDKMYVS